MSKFVNADVVARGLSAFDPEKVAMQARRIIVDGLTRGVRQAMAIHKRLGHSVVVWRDGKVVWLPAEEIEVDISESDNPKPYPVKES